MFNKFYTTQMSGSAKTLNKRFSRIQSKNGFTAKIITAAATVTIISAMTFATAVMAAVNPRGSGEYTVYNGSTALDLAHAPFAYDGQIYIPLRETLNAFGINDIRWDNGKIKINMPPAEHDELWAEQCEISVGSNDVNYPDVNQHYHMYAQPILSDDIVYVPGYFFDDLIRMGQIPDYSLEINKDLSPESYYEAGEEVFIGTLAEQDAYKPVDENGNARYVKRIIVDENRNTIAVVTVENQTPEKLSIADFAHGGGDNLHSNGYSNMFMTSFVTWNAYGHAVHSMNGYIIYESQESSTPIAYIPPEYQINIPKLKLPPDMDI